MIMIDDKLISEDLIEKAFVCDLNACKGACCVEGDAGAPVEAEEREKLRKIWPTIKKFIPKEGRNAIARQGFWTEPEEGYYVTPLVDGKECAYVVREGGMIMCGIEKAYRAGLIDFQKPISCHLYPIRLHKMDEMTALNYEKWSICSAACKKGERLQVPVYRFAKEPIIRKFGEAFYNKLEEVAGEYKNRK